MIVRGAIYSVSMLMGLVAIALVAGCSEPQEPSNTSPIVEPEATSLPPRVVESGPTNLIRPPSSDVTAVSSPTKLPIIARATPRFQSTTSIVLEPVLLNAPCLPDLFSMFDWPFQRFVQWSSDDSWLLFDHVENDSPRPFEVAVYAVKPDGSQLERLPKVTTDLGGPRLVEFLDPPLGESEDRPTLESLADDRLLAGAIGYPGVSGGMLYFEISPDGTGLVYAKCDHSYDDERSILGSEDFPGLVMKSETAVKSKLDMEIYVSTVDGEKETQITTNGVNDAFPTWSYDGSKIAFVSRGLLDPPHLGPLYITDGDGSNLRAIDLPFRVVPLPHPIKWRPEHHSIAFVAGDASQENLGVVYTVELDTAEIIRISETVSTPSWSPSGEQMALAKLSGDIVGLFVMDGNGANERLVAKITDIETFQDPEGRYVSARAFRKSDARNLRPVMPFFHPPDYPWIHTLSWSPDGLHLMHSCDSGICVVDMAGNTIWQSQAALVPFPVATWSPDGSEVAVRAGGIASPLVAVRTWGVPFPLDEHDVLLYTASIYGAAVDILVVITEEGTIQLDLASQ